MEESIKTQKLLLLRPSNMLVMFCLQNPRRISLLIMFIANLDLTPEDMVLELGELLVLVEQSMQKQTRTYCSSWAPWRNSSSSCKRMCNSTKSRQMYILLCQSVFFANSQHCCVGLLSFKRRRSICHANSLYCQAPTRDASHQEPVCTYCFIENLYVGARAHKWHFMLPY